MLSQLQHLTLATDGRYATNAELQFLQDYVKSYALRVDTYQTLQASEAAIVQQVHAQMTALDPMLLRSGGEDLTVKWKRDTVRVLRYSSVAMLFNDPDTMRERFLLWFQTIMRAFGAQKSCDATYEAMQQVTKNMLTPIQASLVCPVLELNRRSLGSTLK